MAKLSSVILRNKGCPVETCVVQPTEAGLRRVLDEEGSPTLEKRWVRFTANSIADIEEHFGSLGEFEEATGNHPFKAVRQALAIIWEVEPREAGEMMVDGKINDYSTAIGTALAIANGVDPTQAAALLEMGLTAVAEAMDERRVEVQKVLDEAAAERAAAKAKADAIPTNATPSSHGSNGSALGSEPDEILETSGNSLQLSSVS